MPTPGPGCGGPATTCTTRSRPCAPTAGSGAPTSACRSPACRAVSPRPGADIAGASFPITTVGHVGDGNFHLGLIVDPSSEAELAEAAAINDRLVRRAIAMEGTCTGEHGIGSGKIKFMELEHGAAIGVMRAIKRALDPLGILNPGKVLPGKVLSGEAD